MQQAIIHFRINCSDGANRLFSECLPQRLSRLAEKVAGRTREVQVFLVRKGDQILGICKGHSN
jgi:hypothetical protein